MQQNALTHKVALITGAARRVGAVIAKYLHAAEMNIVLHYHHSADAALQLSAYLNEIRPSSAVVVNADLAESGSEKVLIERAVAAWGRLDVLVNNASRFYRTAFGQVSEFAWNDLLNSNLKAPFFLAQQAAPYLGKVRGSIVNITDIHAERPLADYAVYNLSKSGLLALTPILAKELGPDVRVNAVAPGAVMWPEGENFLSPEEKRSIIATTLLKQAGSPDDIAKAVLFLTRDADYITGQVLNVDGGRIWCQ